VVCIVVKTASLSTLIVKLVADLVPDKRGPFSDKCAIVK